MTRKSPRRAEWSPAKGALNALPTRCGFSASAPRTNSSQAAATDDGRSRASARWAALDHVTEWLTPSGRYSGGGADRQRVEPAARRIARGWICARKRVGHAPGHPPAHEHARAGARPCSPDRPDGAEKSAPPAADLAEIHRLELEQARSEARVMRAERDAAQTIADERQRIIALLEAPRNIPSAAENAHPE